MVDAVCGFGVRVGTSGWLAGACHARLTETEMALEICLFWALKRGRGSVAEGGGVVNLLIVLANAP